MSRNPLPQRRDSETIDFRFWNQPLSMTVGYYDDGTPGEVFIDGGKTGQDVQSTARDAAVVLSIALQHGMPLDTIRHAVTRNGSGEPGSVLGAIVDLMPEISRSAEAARKGGAARCTLDQRAAKTPYMQLRSALVSD